VSLERDILRAYVTQDDPHKYDGLAEGMVAVYVTHSLLKQRVVDLRLDLHSSIAAVKAKLYTHCGSNIQCMRLQLLSEDGTFVRSTCSWCWNASMYSSCVLCDVSWSALVARAAPAGAWCCVSVSATF
jgi:hypothetical protein